MDAFNARRMKNINDDFDDILKEFRASASRQTAVTDRVVKYAERVLSSVLSAPHDGDFSLESAEKIIAIFDVEFQKIGMVMERLLAISMLRKKDNKGNIIPASTAAAVAAFITKYNIDSAENFNRYDAF